MIKEDITYTDGCIFEGMTSISAVIDGGNRKIEKILYDKAKADKLSRKLSYLSKAAAVHGFTVEATDEAEIDGMTVGKSHGGIVALCGQRNIRSVDSDDLTGGFYVYVEGIEDPYNFGYALRSLYAAGCDGVLLSERNWMSAAGVVCRSSAGASELLKLYIAPPDFTDVFKSRGYKIICADTENSKSVYETECKMPLLLIVGGEKRGISHAVLQSADEIVRIDYGREFPQALSAASAASVLAFEIMRQNK